MQADWPTLFCDELVYLANTKRKYLKQDGQLNTQNTFFISSDVYRKVAFGKLHPLSGKRVSAVIDLCFAMGWLNQDMISNSEAASFETLSQFHDPDYIRALRQSDISGIVEKDIREKYKFGTMENPLFKGLYERAATTVGGSQLAAKKVESGGVAYHPWGGTHHGRTDRASGFCYFNDPVFAILELLDQGLTRVAYVDLDAHHGDGVQDALYNNQKVWTFSIHEENRWPHTGAIDDHGGGRSLNIPVPIGLNDTEFKHLLNETIYPKIQEIDAEAIVITLGADGLAGDPLSKMNLSNGALWDAALHLITLSPRTVILGGGGYNPWTTIRCWSGLWGRIAGCDVDVPLNEKGRAVLSALESNLIDEDEIEDIWLTRIMDPERSGVVRPEIVERAKKCCMSLTQAEIELTL